MLSTTIDKKNGWQTKIYSLIIGIFCGLVNGIFGGGGGMILVPLLTGIQNFEVKKAHATAIIIILPLSIVSGIIYSSFGFVDILKLVTISLGSILGGVLGATFLSKLSTKTVSIIFSFIMLFAGVKLLFFR